jgi:hypothetical protein
MCPYCGKEFELRYPTQKYCKPSHCKQDSKRRKRNGIPPTEYSRDCAICGSPFVTVSPSSLCCSKPCSDVMARKHNNRSRGYLKRTSSCFLYVYKIKIESGCSRCPERRPNCLQFHHIDPNSKVSTISKLVSNRANFKLLKKEISKCIILCANCHAVEETGDGYNNEDRPKGNQ